MWSCAHKAKENTRTPPRHLFDGLLVLGATSQHLVNASSTSRGTCIDTPVCPANQYLTGKSTTSAGTCAACSNAQCGPRQYRKDTCGGERYVPAAAPSPPVPTPSLWGNSYYWYGQYFEAYGLLLLADMSAAPTGDALLFPQRRCRRLHVRIVPRWSVSKRGLTRRAGVCPQNNTMPGRHTAFGQHSSTNAPSSLRRENGAQV